MGLKKMQKIRRNAPINSIESFVVEFMISQDIDEHGNCEEWFLYWCDILLSNERINYDRDSRYHLKAMRNLHKAYLTIRSCA